MWYLRVKSSRNTKIEIDRIQSQIHVPNKEEPKFEQLPFLTQRMEETVEKTMYTINESQTT